MYDDKLFVFLLNFVRDTNQEIYENWNTTNNTELIVHCTLFSSPRFEHAENNKAIIHFDI